MLLLVGLGNPGRRYAGNRHNIGFMAADAIARRHGFPPFRSKFQGEFAEGVLGDERVLALKPMTYMNESGRSVQAAMAFFRVPPEDVVVLHDEIDLASGRLKVKRGGGHGGHNGVRSIQAHIGPDFRRVRLGVGRPGEPAAVVGHVLDDFAKADQEWLSRLLEAVAEHAPLLARGDDSGFMNRIALALNPPRPRSPKPDEGVTETE